MQYSDDCKINKIFANITRSHLQHRACDFLKSLIAFTSQLEYLIKKLQKIRVSIKKNLWNHFFLQKQKNLSQHTAYLAYTFTDLILEEILMTFSHLNTQKRWQGQQEMKNILKMPNNIRLSYKVNMHDHVFVLHI